MQATAKNEKTARDIINVLAEKGCTVSEATDILRYVTSAIKNHSKVLSINEKLFEIEGN